MNSGIYLISNKVNNMTYIGSSKDVRRRIRDHRYKYKDAKNNPNWYNHKLYVDMRRYGLENFEFTILENCSEDLLKERELFYYNKFEPEYNTWVPVKDDRNKGKFKHSEETKQKIKDHNARYWKGKTLPPEMLESMIEGNVKKRKPVQALNSKGDIILEFDKIGDALKYFNEDPNSTTIISKCCKNHNKTAFGLYWQFK